MKNALRKTISRVCAVLAAFSIGGCASMQAPTGHESSYPNSWPKLEGLGAECKDLEGSYKIGGVFIDSDGTQNQLSIIDLFSLRNTSRVEVVHLAVNTSKKDPNKDTIGHLQVIADGDNDNSRLYESFCIRNILFFVASAGGGVIRPVVWGNQQNVWLGRGVDGSLIAKIGNYTAGAVGFVPFYSEAVGWARFFKMPCDSSAGCFQATPASKQQ